MVIVRNHHKMHGHGCKKSIAPPLNRLAICPGGCYGLFNLTRLKGRTAHG